MLPQMACVRSAAQSTALLLFLASILLGCNRKDSAPPVASLVLRSSSFAGDTIPAKYQGSREDGPCDGQDISPELSWGAPPERTQSFALIVTDKDSPFVAAILLGMTTGIGGGMIRDLLVMEIPTVLRTEPYAVAALVGAAFTVGGQRLGMPLHLAAPLGALRTEGRGYMPLQLFRMHAVQFSRCGR